MTHDWKARENRPRAVGGLPMRRKRRRRTRRPRCRTGVAVMPVARVGREGRAGGRVNERDPLRNALRALVAARYCTAGTSRHRPCGP